MRWLTYGTALDVTLSRPIRRGLLPGCRLEGLEIKPWKW
jgi:hypothetical protein